MGRCSCTGRESCVHSPSKIFNYLRQSCNWQSERQVISKMEHKYLRTVAQAVLGMRIDSLKANSDKAISERCT